jgi:hypothetical protein
MSSNGLCLINHNITRDPYKGNQITDYRRFEFRSCLITYAGSKVECARVDFRAKIHETLSLRHDREQRVMYNIFVIIPH